MNRYLLRQGELDSMRNPVALIEALGVDGLAPVHVLPVANVQATLSQTCDVLRNVMAPIGSDPAA